MVLQLKHSLIDANTIEILLQQFKILITGCLEDFVLKLGGLRQSFTEQEKIFFSLSKTEKIQQCITGQVQMINYNGQMSLQLVWVEVHWVDSEYILKITFSKAVVQRHQLSIMKYYHLTKTLYVPYLKYGHLND